MTYYSLERKLIQGKWRVFINYVNKDKAMAMNETMS